MDFIRVGAKMAVLLWGAMLVNASAAFTIQDITLIQFKLPKKTAFVTSKGTSDSCPGIFVVVRASDGTRSITSVGEVLPRALVTNETSKDAWSGAQAFRSVLLDQSLSGDSLASDRETVGLWMNDLFAIAAEQKLTTQSPPGKERQLRATLCGFDMALLDLVGQIYGVSIAAVLGGAVRKEVAISATTFSADLDGDELEGKVDSIDSSYRAVRIKIGLDLESDLKKLRAVAGSLVAEGRQREIWVDVNQAWKDAPHAIDYLSKVRDELKAAGFTSRFICEQPTAESDIAAMGEVTRQTREWAKTDPFRIVIMADESMWDVEDARKIVALDAADAVNIKIVKAGGLIKSMELGQYLASAAPGIEVYVGGLIMTDISATANLQLCMALPRLDYATGPLPRTHSYPAQPASAPLAYTHDRTLELPNQPGLGTGLDQVAIKPFVTKTFPAEQMP